MKFNLAVCVETRPELRVKVKHGSVHITRDKGISPGQTHRQSETRE